jgi:hypothetical protein
LLRLADDEAARLLVSIPDEARDDCWWLVLRDEAPIPGNAGGGVALLMEIRLTRPFGSVLRVLRAFRLVDALDTFVSRRRGALGRVVPDGPAPRRYP